MTDPSEDLKTIADLKTQVADLETKNKALLLENDTLKGAQAEQKKAVAELETKNKALSQELLTSTGQVEQAKTIVTELKTQLAEKAAGSVELPVVTSGKDTYELVGGDFLYKGREISIETLKSEPKLVAELVSERVGNLRKK